MFVSFVSVCPFHSRLSYKFPTKAELTTRKHPCLRTASQKKKFPSVTYQGLPLLAEHQPRVRPAIYTALLDRLAVVSRHMIV